MDQAVSIFEYFVFALEKFRNVYNGNIHPEVDNAINDGVVNVICNSRIIKNILLNKCLPLRIRNILRYRYGSKTIIVRNGQNIANLHKTLIMLMRIKRAYKKATLLR